MKLRCEHKKIGLFRFLSGIQLSLLVDESLRRTGYRFEYTNGFNPRIKVNFSLPVPVGVASVSEIFDVSLKDEIEESDFMRTYNSHVQNEIKLKNVVKIPEETKSIVNSIYSYEYKLFLNKSEKRDLMNIIENYEDKKGKIINFKVKQVSELNIVNMIVTADQDKYFNIGNFVMNTNIKPIIIIKTKTYTR